MSWTHADTGSCLEREIDCSEKQETKLWLLKDRQLFIPENDQLHGRPIILLRGEDQDKTFALILFRNRIEGQFHKKRKILVEL